MGQMDDEYYAGVGDGSKNKTDDIHNGRLIVRNISFKATPEALKEHFSKFGDVIEVKLLKKPDGRLVGCGFVHYKEVEVAEKAIAATDKKPFLDRTIHVAWALSKQKYTQNMDKNDPKATKRFHSASNDENAPHPKEENGPGETDKPKEEKNKMRVNRNARLIVRNISFKATEETLKQHFEPYGTILDVNLLKKPNGKLVGCAFVHYKNVPMAKKALLNTNMKPFLGRPISVDWAVAKNKYMQHVVSQQIELEENIKQEDSDSDDDNKPPLNISNDDLKQEVKSESDSDAESDNKSDDSDDEVENKSEESDGEVKNESEDDDDEDDDDDGEEDDDEEADEDMDHENDRIDNEPERKRIKLNDAEDGCTVFLSNIAFSVDNDQLKEFAEKTGPVKYALICIDKLTEHSKGSGFVKFVNKDDADKFLALPVNQLKLEGQAVLVKPALKRENLVKGNKKEAKDNRNLYLVKEGVVVAGTKAAVGVSGSDMSKRLALERSKTQMLKNLNRFVSRYRIVVSNLPAHFDDAKLRRVCTSAVGERATITEARVMRDLRSPTGRDGKHPSKGYGFVMFMRHEDALACLRKLNNNPDIFDRNNRPIVSFSIEDRTALNARKKRLEKSIANNPLARKDGDSETTNRRDRKRKQISPDESYAKMRKFGKKKMMDRNADAGKFVRNPGNEEMGEFTGLTARQGSQHHMRSNHKLKAQAEIHRQTVKMEKKKSKRSMRLKQAARERIKQPKQKINKDKNKKRNKKFKSFDV